MKAISVKRHREIQRYSRNQMERFLQGVFQCGIQNGVQQVTAASSCWTDQEIYELLRGEKIGEDRAWRIVGKIMSRYGGDIAGLGEGGQE